MGSVPLLRLGKEEWVERAWVSRRVDGPNHLEAGIRASTQPKGRSEAWRSGAHGVGRP